ncbi:unnamed protein product [Rotaria magnacalcarata]|uniref:Uncharacterized protein n=1 Tax=Rotaria magnacalcarata TaxID=392030 RepID=A0A819ZUQ3_9BILA|nr:unnamed protein product [Rotaria magnacalcarata]
MSARDCKIKFHIYLLYATRPKIAAKNYSIHIDIYEKISLVYRESLLLPIVFTKYYSGNRCEIVDNEIHLALESHIVLSQWIFIHFIQAINNSRPIGATTLRTIPFTQDSLTIYWSRPFHLVVVELHTKVYYLAANEKAYTQSIAFVQR